jgi:undecaprenyl-diphosphatase
MIMSLDISLFSALNGMIGKSPVRDGVILFFAKYYIFILIATIVVLAIRAYKKDRMLSLQFAAALASAVIARLGVAELIRFFYHRPRPFVALGASHLFTDSAFSFPSGHTIFLLALAAALYTLNKRLGIFIGISGLVVGLARVAAGVHYPTDILGGIVLGILVGVLSQHVLVRFASSRMRVNT